MLKENIILTSQDILEKEFKLDTRGFRCKEVDQFLDLIMHDYVEYNTIIDKLSGENKELMEEILKLKNALRNAEVQAESAPKTEQKEITNLDLLRRLSHLEKIVYGIEEK